MVFDWLMREGWIIFSWWLVSSLMGLTVLPALVRLVPALPDKGYTLARPVGLLMISFVFWFLGISGFINNSVGSIVFSWVLVAVLAGGIFATGKSYFSWREWWGNNRKLVIIAEVLFVVLLVGFAVFRAYQNNYISTEKPMDLAFMTAIQQSESFPPNDPWLSGYAISYYYFGYLMASVNALLVGVAGTIGYNMHLALIFALAGMAVFGVVYNLIRAHQLHRNPRVTKIRLPVSFGLLGVFFLLIMSNFHMAFVELPYQTVSFDASYYRFWDAKGRETMPTGEPVELAKLPEQLPYWWWFSHARTLTERSPDIRLDVGDFYRGEILTEPLQINGTQVEEVIDEFPAFSFILGDSHPHVMTLPFVLLAIGLALNIILSPKTPDLLQTVFYGLCIGALVFLNTWDMPIYFVVILGAEVVRRVAEKGWFGWLDFAYLVSFGVILIVITLIAYSPFLAGFNSQAGGILPNVVHPTRPQQLFLMFGGFGLLLSGYLVYEVWQGVALKRVNWRVGAGLAGLILGGLIAVNLILILVNVIDKSYTNLIADLTYGNLGWEHVNNIVFTRRFETILTLISLMGGLVLVLVRLFPQQQPAVVNEEEIPLNQPYHGTNGFVLLLILCGLGLILLPEFVYLRDNFSTRMNTIFKFYYQVWVLFSISSAYGVYSIITQADRPIKPILRYGYSLILVFVVVTGALYFPAGALSRMFVETGIANRSDAVLTLDGGGSFMDSQDYQAVLCLQEWVGRDQVVVAEANSRSSYNSRYGRVGALTGIPIVMGWQGHQSQWRGQTYGQTAGSRPQDLDRLYTATALTDVISIIERYRIDYIFYGAQEYRDYGAMGEYKFADHYEVVCEAQTEFGTARFYRVNENLHPFITLN